MRNRFFVFDTNVLLSALLNYSSIPARAYNKSRYDGVLLISDETAAEYIRVFARERFEKYASLNDRLEFIDKVISDALPVVIRKPIIACRDPKDDKFLSVAVNGGAGCIVSGDSDLLVLHPFQNISILTPADFFNNYDTTISNRH